MSEIRETRSDKFNDFAYFIEDCRAGKSAVFIDTVSGKKIYSGAAVGDLVLQGKISELKDIRTQISNYETSGASGVGYEDAVPVTDIDDRIAELEAVRKGENK